MTIKHRIKRVEIHHGLPSWSWFESWISSLANEPSCHRGHGLNPGYPALQLGTKQQQFGIFIVLKAIKKSVNYEIW
jgi:hypothetical protein